MLLLLKTATTMEHEENKQNQAGPSSAPPETQDGLKQTNKSSEEIIGGARQEDQLDQFKANSEDTGELNSQPRINDKRINDNENA